MTDLIIRIAKIRGWEYKRVLIGVSGCGETWAYKWVDLAGDWHDSLPNWSGSLDLMHELIRDLTADEWIIYHTALWDIVNPNSVQPNLEVDWKSALYVYEPTAAQKAEAWCRTKERT